MPQDEKYVDAHHYVGNDYEQPRELYKFLSEKILPSFTPETLVDSSPVIKMPVFFTGYKRSN